ncbi:hypothetical protein pEaSNUABM8_00238 [Erwinia phage pEa_SNUABM_8]|nr:hypothetical protein pEaSNUABM8_00238 [Erwinia phage pEa_SNUABM_8]QVW54990.1 hypothetical protein pEaSNUABM4_00237 [Erwinia phage pEa_SNUABM_4]
MNISTTVAQYLADFARPGLTLVSVPATLDLRIDGAPETPTLYSLSGDYLEVRRRLGKIRAEAVAENQMRVLYIDNTYDAGRLDQEADVVLAVSFGMDSGKVEVKKYRGAEEKPKDTYFIYEA